MNAKFRAYSKTLKGWMYFTLQDLCETNIEWDSFIWWGQWTGLKDREQADIYSGDRVRDVSGQVFTVDWTPPYFSCCRKGQSEGAMLETHFYDLSVIVLGPKWENPEL